MAFSSIDVTPASVNLVLNYGSASNTANNVKLDIVAKNSDGTIFDATDATAAMVHLDNGRFSVFNATTTIAPTLITHDATKVTLRLAAADIITALAALYSTDGKLTVVLTDGVNSLLVGKGSWTMPVLP